MKMQKNILEKVREYEYKRGICYEKPEDNIYKRFRIFYFIVFGFTFIVNLAILLGDVTFPDIPFSKKMQATVIACTALLVAALVWILFNKKMWSHIAFLAVNIGSGVVLCLAFAKVLREVTGVILAKFYYCHLVPLCLLVLVAIFMSIIAIRADLKTRNLYKRIVDELYSKNFSIEDSNLSEKEWNDLLKSLWS